MSLTGVEELNRWGHDRHNVGGGRPDQRCVEEDRMDPRPGGPKREMQAVVLTERPTKSVTAPLAASWEQ
jgi:hypothetical protein